MTPGVRQKKTKGNNKGRITFLQWNEYADEECGGSSSGEGYVKPLCEKQETPQCLTLSDRNPSFSASSGSWDSNSSRDSSASKKERKRQRQQQQQQHLNPYSPLSSNTGFQKTTYTVGEWVSLEADETLVHNTYTSHDTLEWNQAVLSYLGKKGTVQEVCAEDGTMKIMFGDGKYLWCPVEAVLSASRKKGGRKVPDKGLVHYYVVRHGESNWNVIGRLQGQKDTVLTDRGMRQASEARAGLVLPDGIDAVLVSPLQRAMDTASLMFPEEELPGEHVVDERLMEISLGSFEGCMSTDPAVRTFMRSLNHTKRWPNGESARDVALRALCSLKDASFLGQHIAVVTHGGVISALVRSILGHKPFQHTVKNCSLTHLTYHPVSGTWGVVF
eukprot:TRINITY_DN2875_c0_g1_i1.p1 TRINITY_DN2875_c0_g1~~TRINITY_DN2875_c0_g1_i1.p1  ORF type:complete len:387 (+),score=110.93 TRINITY_DN2875_c0_g1_i1:38-1198(+)